ncbi:MAG TPA: nuclear transport factor 2 family protein [Rubrobacteraceae bacterium]|nr:nuclear transport factor 2 family protein [Rubrobacteraceae bacterium]
MGFFVLQPNRQVPIGRWRSGGLKWAHHHSRPEERPAPHQRRLPHINVGFVSREEIRAGIERLQGLWDYFVQNSHPGTIRLEGDTAVGRAYIVEFGRMREGSSHLNYSVYHDRYQRTSDGWKFTERVYEVRYLDTTPLAGSAPKVLHPLLHLSADVAPRDQRVCSR